MQIFSMKSTSYLRNFDAFISSNNALSTWQKSSRSERRNTTAHKMMHHFLHHLQGVPIFHMYQPMKVWKNLNNNHLETKMWVWKLGMTRLSQEWQTSMVLHGSSPPYFRGDLKISDQNNWGGPEQKLKFGGELNLRGDPKF